MKGLRPHRQAPRFPATSSFAGQSVSRQSSSAGAQASPSPPAPRPFDASRQSRQSQLRGQPPIGSFEPRRGSAPIAALGFRAEPSFAASRPVPRKRQIGPNRLRRPGRWGQASAEAPRLRRHPGLAPPNHPAPAPAVPSKFEKQPPATRSSDESAPRPLPAIRNRASFKHRSRHAVPTRSSGEPENVRGQSLHRYTRG